MRFVDHEDLEKLHGATIVWRYMGLDKFLDLLTQRRLFFTNAFELSDGYEVTLPHNIIESTKKKLISRGLSGRELEEEMARFEMQNRPMRDLTLVNCWSIGRQESYALWKIYLGGSKAGVAIRTKFSSIKKGITEGKDPYSEDIYSGIVQYQDTLQDKDLSRFRLITTKRKFYEYENELRLFILHYPMSEGGVKPPYRLSSGRYVSVDLATLIDEVYLSPFAAPWFGSAMRKLVDNIAPYLANRLTVSSIRDS